MNFPSTAGAWIIDDWNDGEDDDGVPPPGLVPATVMALSAAAVAFFASVLFG